MATNGAQANAASLEPSISDDGRYITFQSSATNLVSGDTNGTGDIFIRDRQTNTTARMSVGANGAQGTGSSSDPAISGDGRYVASLETSISGDGRSVAFDSLASNLVTGDTNAVRDVFLRDRSTGSTTRVSIGMMASQGNGGSFHPTISNDGAFIAFASDATNLVAGDTNATGDAFVRNRTAGTTAYDASISGDGTRVAFRSSATNLVPNDTNGWTDIFVRYWFVP